MKKSLGVLVVGLAGAAFGWWSQDGEQPYGKISDDFVSPHFEICPNPAAKTPKVFFTAWGVGQREIVELKERFALEPVLYPQFKVKRFYPFDGDKFGHEELYAASMDDVGYREASAKVMAKLPSCDVVVFGKLDPTLRFPEKFLDRVFAKVKSGAGLVWIAPYFEKVEIPGVTLTEINAENLFPCSIVPSLRGTKVYEGMLGKGKVLQIVYPEPKEWGWGYSSVDTRKTSSLETLTPYESDDPLYYDFCHAFLGKCIWKVMGYRGLEGLGSLGGLGGLETVETFYNAEGEVTDRDSLSAVAKIVRKLDANGKTVDYTIGKVENASAAAQRLGLVFEKDGFKPGETVVGKLVAPAGDVKLSVVDEYGREIWRETKRVAAGETALSLPIVHQKSRFARVKATVRAGGKVRDEASAKVYFNTVAEDREDFCFSIWSDHRWNSRVSRLAIAQMRREGVDNIMDCTWGGTTFQRKREIIRWIKEGGCNFSNYNEALRGSTKEESASKDCKRFGQWEKYKKGDRKFKEPCTNPRLTHWCKTQSGLYDHALAECDVGVYFYNIGDENTLGWEVEKENCFCDECQRRFRVWLKREFGSLEAFNREGRTKYASWDEVKALPFIESAKKHRLMLWACFREFMCEQFTDYHRAYAAVFREHCPEVNVGCEGMAYPANSFTGWNFYKFLPHFNFAAPYFNDRDAKAITQWMPKDSVKAAWYGVYESECASAFTRRPPWRYLFAGLGGAFWWYAGFTPAACSFSGCTVFRPDLTILSNFHDSAEEIRSICESGIGRLLHDSQEWNEDVEVHYSNWNMYASTIEPGMTTWEISLTEFIATLAEANVGFRYRTPKELEAGIPDRVKAFLLPNSMALSEKECASLRAFVKRGGVLIADMMPGTMTGHCQFRETSPIADLFDEKPLKVKRTGKGAAVLLDDYLRGIDAKIGNNTAGGVAKGFRELLALGGAKPFAEVSDENGSPRTAIVRTTGGGFSYVCMLGGMAAKGNVEKAAGAESGGKKIEALGGSPKREIKLPKKMWAYDLGKEAKGRCLGYGDLFKLELEPVIGRIIAFSEREVKAPTVTLAKTGLWTKVAGASVKPGEPLEYTLGSVGGCAIVEAVDPSGKVAFAERVTCGRGRFVPAFNDAKGKWTLRVRNAIGGQTASVGFKVK